MFWKFGRGGSFEDFRYCSRLQRRRSSSAQPWPQFKRRWQGFAEAGWETELIVCDNNSRDRTADLARAAGALVVFEPVNQIARARNRGAEAASGDWLVFIDADSQPSRELFAEVVEAIQAGRCLYGGCTIKLDAAYPFATMVVELWNGISRVGKYAAGALLFFAAIGAFARLWRL